MKIKNKILIGTGLTIPVTVIYYFTYVLVDKLFSSWCKTNYCFEFPPYADVLAIWVAIIGLYFVVTSIDAWKQQDQYQTAKSNINKLHTLKEILNVYVVKISNLEKQDSSLLENFQSVADIEKTKLFKQYEKFATNIFKELYAVDHEINLKNKNLFQEDFSKVIKFATDFVFNVDADIRAKNKLIIDQQNHRIVEMAKKQKESEEIIDQLPEKQKNSLQMLTKLFNQNTLARNNQSQMNMTQQDIDTIITKHHHLYTSFNEGVRLLQERIKNFVE